MGNTGIVVVGPQQEVKNEARPQHRVGVQVVHFKAVERHELELGGGVIFGVGEENHRTSVTQRRCDLGGQLSVAAAIFKVVLKANGHQSMLAARHDQHLVPIVAGDAIGGGTNPAIHQHIAKVGVEQQGVGKLRLIEAGAVVGEKDEVVLRLAQTTAEVVVAHGVEHAVFVDGFAIAGIVGINGMSVHQAADVNEASAHCSL